MWSRVRWGATRRALAAAAALVLLLAAGDLAAAPESELPRLPVCGDRDDPGDPLRFQCAEFEAWPELQTYRLPGADLVPLRFDFVFRGGTFDNELGFFVVDDEEGAIGDLNPGDPGYLEAAFQRATLVFPSGSDPFTPDVTYSFEGGEILVFFIVQRDSLKNLLAGNPDNLLDLEPRAFFSLHALNLDETSHFVAFRNTVDDSLQFSFEDLTFGGDADYDDIAFTVRALPSR